MATYVPAKINTQYIFYAALVSQANTKIMQVNPTIAAGDFKVSIDGGALANLGTLPAVTPGSSVMVKFTLSTSEMNGANITVVCSDAAGSEWCDAVFNIQTSARQVDDLAFPTTSGRSIDVTTTGEVGIDWANIGAPTTTVALTGTTIATTQKVDIETIKTNPVVNAGTITFPTTATLASTTNITAGTITTATNVTTVNGLAANVITAAATAADFGAEVAAAVWQDTVAGDFTVASSVGKSVYTGVAPGANTGLFIAGTNAATTITTALTTTFTGNLTGSVGSVTGAVGSVTGNVGGNVVGSVASVTARVTANTDQWNGATVGAIPPDAVFIRSGTAQAGGASTITLDASASATNNLYQNETIFIRSGTGAGQSNIIASYVGATKVATVATAWATTPDNTSVFTILADGPSIASVSGTVNANVIQVAGQTATAAAGVTFPSSIASPTNITAGTITTVTNLTNAPTAGDFTATMKTSLNAATPASVVGSVGSVTGNVGGNVTGTVGGLAAAAKTDVENATWNTVLSSHLTGGSTGAALNAAGSAGDPWTTSLPGAYTAGSAGFIVGTNLNATVSSRMATYTQPTGFLAATFPGTVASTTNITAGTITTATNLTNAPTNGDFTSTMKTSLNSSTPASITGAVGSVTGNVGGNVTGSVGSVVAGVTVTTNNDKTGYALSSAGNNSVADATLNRDMGSVSDTNTRSLLNAIRFIRNKWSISGSTLTVTKENDSTSAWTAAVSTDAAAIPIVGNDPT